MLKYIITTFYKINNIIYICTKNNYNQDNNHKSYYY